MCLCVNRRLESSKSVSKTLLEELSLQSKCCYTNNYGDETNIQDQAAWGSEQPGPEGGVPDLSGVLE